MIRRLFSLSLLFRLCVVSLCAQPLPGGEFVHADDGREWEAMVRSDTTLFYRAVQSPDDLYARIADYRLSFTAQSRRGVPGYVRTMFLHGMDLNRVYEASLRMLELSEIPLVGTAAEANVYRGGDLFDLFDGSIRPRSRLSLRFTDRNYRAGVRFSYACRPGREWELSAGVEARTGRDMHIQGVFTQALTVAVRAGKTWSGGWRLGLVASLPVSLRGVRTSSTEETFTLTGDPYYNPGWGYQNGRIRNSHVRRECLPMVAVVLGAEPSTSTSLTAAIGLETGVRRYSSLEWFDARTPVPDDYRSLPSYFSDPQVAAIVADRWRSEDARYTQIDWDELYAQNRMRNDDPAFVLADRVERVTGVRFTVKGRTDAGPGLAFHYGLRLRFDRSRNYKEVRDLLGGGGLNDIDYYLIDGDTYRNSLRNDLRHPDRRVGEGGRYGYDYALVSYAAGVFGTLEFHSDRFRFVAGLRVDDFTLRRRGYYEKELFPGEGSFGRSRSISLTPYVLSISAGWAFTPSQYLQLGVTRSAEAPEAADLFLQPQYNNRTVDDPAALRRWDAALDYRFSGRRVRLQLTAFASLSRGEIQTRSHFDDLASQFCDRVVSGIGLLCYGIEGAADIRFSYRWQLSLAAAGARYRYADNPVVCLYADADNTLIDAGSQSYMNGCTQGGAPQLTGTAGFSYFGRGWGFRLSASYAGFRYAEPDPLRRTARVAVQSAESPEAFRIFMEQERLSDAFTLDASVWKSFRFGSSRLTASLSACNLLNDTAAAYHAYESPRIRRIRSGSMTYYRPFDNRLTYAYGRSFFLSVSYEF